MTPAKKRDSIPCRKAAYIRENFHEYSNNKLSKTLNIEKNVLREYLAENRLIRTTEETRAFDDSNNSPEYQAELSLPATCISISRKCMMLMLIPFCISFIVYLMTLAPTVTGEDSGELITAAYRLGIAHPPGYPLWCLLGKIFTAVVPVGNIAYRVNLMSAFWAAAAAALLFLLAFKICGNVFASLGASMSFAFFKDFWSQSVIAETYTLNIFLITLMLLLLLSYYQQRKLWLIWALALVSGLMLVHHNTATPIVLLSWAALLYISPIKLLKPKAFCISALLLLAGLSVFLYLPIRSAANPPMDWGNPETLPSMLDHIMRKQYAFSYTENPRELGVFLRQLGVLSRLSASQGTILFPILALAGLPLLWEKDRRILTFLGAITIVCGPVLLFVINSELERESIETIKPFFLPVYVAMVLISAVALAHIGGSFPGRKAVVLASSSAVALIALLPLIRNYHESDKSNYYYAYDYGMNLLKTVEQDGVIFSSSDHSTFPLIYLQSIEGVRPDVTIADKYGYIEKELYHGMPSELTSRFRKIPSSQERNMIERWIIENVDRPIFFTKKRNMQNLFYLELVPWGLTYKLVRKADPPAKPESDLWSMYELRCLNDWDSYEDYSAHSILGDYHFARGREHLYYGNVQEARDEFELVAEHGNDVKEIYNNLGSVCAESGLVTEGIGYYWQAVEIDPTYLLALRNLAKLYEHMGDYPNAIDYQKKVLTVSPDDHQATFDLAKLYELTGDYDNAITTYKKAIEMEPRDFRPFRALGFIYWSLPNARQRALHMFTESLNRNPNQPDVEGLMNQGAIQQGPMH